MSVKNKSEKIALINPNLVSLKEDFITTGIVYMPIGLVSVATVLSKRHEVRVIDSFGEAPTHIRCQGKFLFSGLSPSEILERLPPDTDIIFVSADRLINHISLVEIIKTVKGKFPSKRLVVFENAQAVTAYSLKEIANELHEMGVDDIIHGDPEEKVKQMVGSLEGNGNPSLDNLPFPDWRFLPLQNYWNLRYAHGPFESDRYLPLLTSRGCPYPCQFCVIPETNNLKWQGRSAKNVVDEMEMNLHRFNVREFHIEDVNPTVSDDRIRQICQEIIRRKLDVIWKLVSGTKVETIKNEETIHLMRQGGCRYISISPESGSERIMKAVQKSFNFEHARRLIQAMNKEGIVSQACFIIGYPGETDEDRWLTKRAVKELAQAGVDEITLPIITPVPGSKIFNQFNGFQNYSELNFSPSWREDYDLLNQFRLSLYTDFLLWKLRYFPLKFMQHPINFLRRRFRTKMEMTPYRVLKTKWRYLFSQNGRN